MIPAHSVILLTFIFVTLIATTISLIIPHRQKRAPNGQFCREGRFALTCTYYPLTPADLTPAIDKFIRFPSTADDVTSPLLSAKGPAPSGPDPFHLVKDELDSLADHVKKAVENENSVLSMAASHFFMKRQGKSFRPTIVALLGRALSGDSLDEYLQSPLQKKHLQLGQIAEMIHVASLIHDDVLDDADVRRGGAAVHTMFSTKVAVLAGDFLLARASVLLARLQHTQVVEIMASALDSLVQGELMQARANQQELSDMNHYLRKTYYKTSSLICNSCKSVALLSNYAESDPVTKAAEEFGYHLGMTFQIIDDVLDFCGASASLGKPAQADMKLGLATAPVLFASEIVPELVPMIQRRFKNDDDVQQAVFLASQTDCVERSYALAEFHANRAVSALATVPSSDAHSALIKLVHIALSRNK